MAEDDDTWLAGLRGKAKGDSPLQDQELLESLRDTIRRRNLVTEVRHDGPVELEQLLFRLRRERLLGPEPGLRWKRLVPVAASAVIVGGIAMAVLLKVQSPHDIESPVMRGGDAIQVLEVADPNAAAQALQERLRSLGIAAERYEVGGVVGVTATVPAGDRERVRTALASQSTGLPALAPQTIALPADGRLKVEFRSTPRR